MTSLAPTLEAYFTDRLIRQRRVSPHTIASYRDTFRLLLAYIKRTAGTPPSRLQITDLDAATIGAFLQHLEQERGNTARTRNIRVAAIHSFFHYCATSAASDTLVFRPECNTQVALSLCDASGSLPLQLNCAPPPGSGVSSAR
jgi:site-specific recombinase XerD